MRYLVGHTERVLLTMELLDGLEKRPGMYGISGYDQLVIFLTGLHQGSGALVGFQELVELKFGEPSSVGWPSLISKIEPVLADDASDDERRTRLLDLLREFVCFDSGPHGRVGARYSVVAGQAARWYSWMSPSQRVDLTTRRWFGSARG